MEGINQNKTKQNIILESRKKVTISGVKDIDSFDDNNIMMETILGSLMVRGSDLKINGFSVETGDAVIEGVINQMIYDNKKGRNIWSKIIK